MTDNQNNCESDSSIHVLHYPAPLVESPELDAAFAEAKAKGHTGNLLMEFNGYEIEVTEVMPGKYRFKFL